MRKIIHASLLCSALLGVLPAQGAATIGSVATGAAVIPGLGTPPPPPCVPGAANSNQPVNFLVTRVVGQQIQTGQKNAQTWASQLLGQLLNYDTYTTQLDEKAILAASLPTCTLGAVCDFTQPGQVANLNARTLLGTLGLNGDPQRTAALTWIERMTNPNVAYPQDSTVYNDPKNKFKGLTPDGISYFATLFKQIPALSLAQNSLAAIFADRDRLPGLAGSTGVGSGGAASILEMLEFEASRRYMTPCWYDAMVAANEQTVMREMAFMLAFQNYMMVKTFEQNQRIEALMAAQLSTSVGLMNNGAQSNSSANQKKNEQKANQYSVSPS